MKKYFAFSFLGLIISAKIYLLLFQYQLTTIIKDSDSHKHQWLAQYQQVKRQKAQSIKDHKLLIVSGSNSLFGVSCKLLSKDLKIPCVNMATHAGLDLEYILYDAKKYSQPRDIILLTLEYEYYMKGNKPSEFYLEYVSSYDPTYFKDLTINQQLSFALYYGFKKTFHGIILKLINKKTPPQEVRDGCYSGNTVNQFGDETCNQKSKIEAHHIETINKITPISFGFKKNSKTWLLIKDLHKYCLTNNIQLLVSFPSTIYFPEYQNPDSKQFLETITKFYQENNITVLGDPYKFMYEKEMFFDTIYHLHDLGKETRTKQLVSLLKPILQ